MRWKRRRKRRRRGKKWKRKKKEEIQFPENQPPLHDKTSQLSYELRIDLVYDRIPHLWNNFSPACTGNVFTGGARNFSRSVRVKRGEEWGGVGGRWRKTLEASVGNSVWRETRRGRDRLQDSAGAIYSGIGAVSDTWRALLVARLHAGWSRREKYTLGPPRRGDKLGGLETKPGEPKTESIIEGPRRSLEARLASLAECWESSILDTRSRISHSLSRLFSSVLPYSSKRATRRASLSSEIRLSASLPRGLSGSTFLIAVRSCPAASTQLPSSVQGTACGFSRTTPG